MSAAGVAGLGGQCKGRGRWGWPAGGRGAVSAGAGGPLGGGGAAAARGGNAPRARRRAGGIGAGGGRGEWVAAEVPGTEAGAAAGAGPAAEAEAEPEAEPEPGAEAEPEAETEPEAESDAGWPEAGGPGGQPSWPLVPEGVFRSRYAGAMLLHGFLTRADAGTVLARAAGRAAGPGGASVLAAGSMCFPLGAPTTPPFKHPTAARA